MARDRNIVTVQLCNGLRLFFLTFCVFVCDAFQDENTLTINVDVEPPVPDIEQWSTYSPEVSGLVCCKRYILDADPYTFSHQALKMPSTMYGETSATRIDRLWHTSPETSINSLDTDHENDVRCYCNLPVCVATGYMCKSEGGACFSEVVDNDNEQSSFRTSVASTQDLYKGRHGCLELLGNKNQRVECKNLPSARGSYKNQNTKSLLLCCYKDMCNHIDSPETQTILNGTLSGSALNDNPSHPSSISSSHEPNISASPGYNSNEVWFKAAIIAVPICGIVILFLLIFLAVKILRTDSLSASNKLRDPYLHGTDRNSNRDHFDQIHHQAGVNMKKIPLLIHHHHHHHDMMTGACTNHSAADELLKHTAVPLLVQNETGVSYSYDKKNETNAKLNSIVNCHDYNLVANKDLTNESSSHKPLNTSSCNNVYRNVNLSLTPAPTSVQTVSNDKLYDKQVLNAVINWGGASPSSSPV